MAQRVTKEQLILALTYLNNTIANSGGKLVLYLHQQSGYNMIRSQGDNHIFFCGTIRECKGFVDGARDILLMFGS